MTRSPTAAVRGVWMLLLVVALSGGLPVRAVVTNRTATAGTGPRTPGPILAPAPGVAPSNAAPRMALRGEQQRPEEIEDPLKQVWQVGFVAVVAGAAWLAWVLWRRRKPDPDEPPAPPDPAVIARGRIEAARVWMTDPRRYAAEVSDAVRHYLEDRFGLRAPEQTTEEFLGSLGRKPVLDVRHQESLGRFLEQCDLLKFAGWRPGSQELDGLEAAAVWLVDETAPSGPWKAGPVRPGNDGKGAGDAV